MLQFKDSVTINNIKPEMIPVLLIASEVYSLFNLACTVTSVTDSKHSVTSLHYVGFAIDLRTKNIPDEQTITKIINSLKLRLTKEYDVVKEIDHIHIEFQPKIS